MKVHPDVAAWNKWLNSDEGKRCVLSGQAADQYYLENRLWRAFMAGCRSRAKAAKKRG